MNVPTVKVWMRKDSELQTYAFLPSHVMFDVGRFAFFRNPYIRYP